MQDRIRFSGGGRRPGPAGGAGPWSRPSGSAWADARPNVPFAQRSPRRPVGDPRTMIEMTAGSTPCTDRPAPTEELPGHRTARQIRAPAALAPIGFGRVSLDITSSSIR